MDVEEGSEEEREPIKCERVHSHHTVRLSNYLHSIEFSGVFHDRLLREPTTEETQYRDPGEDVSDHVLIPNAESMTELDVFHSIRLLLPSLKFRVRYFIILSPSISSMRSSRRRFDMRENTTRLPLISLWTI
jgi:hypothetical protein